MNANSGLMRVVSNSSPLINLAIIGKLSLLETFFSTVWIPNAVWHECVIEGAGKPGVDAIKEAKFLKRSVPKDAALLRLLQRELDAGESEALVLAIEMQADLILLDERDARNIASIYELKTTGVLGILLRAKREEYITSMRAYLDQLQQEAGFWLDEALRQRILDLVDERT